MCSQVSQSDDFLLKEIKWVQMWICVNFWENLIILIWVYFTINQCWVLPLHVFIWIKCAFLFQKLLILLSFLKKTYTFRIVFWQFFTEKPLSIISYYYCWCYCDETAAWWGFATCKVAAIILRFCCTLLAWSKMPLHWHGQMAAQMLDTIQIRVSQFLLVFNLHSCIM